MTNAPSPRPAGSITRRTGGASGTPEKAEARVAYIVDDDELVRGALSSLLRSIHLEVRAYGSVEEFLAAPRHPDAPSCLVLDVRLRGQSGLAFQKSLADSGESHMPIVFMTAHGDIAMSVKAMKAGAVDFLAKPFRDQDMIDAVVSAIERDAARLEVERSLKDLRAGWESLTPREREVLELVAKGLMNKQIADVMGIALITAKLHRGQAMRKMDACSVADLMHKMQLLGLGFRPPA